MGRRTLVIGGGYAGLMCALRLARKAPDAEVVLASARPWFVERVRLHEDAAGDVRARVPLAARLEGSGVALEIGWIEGVDLERRRALLRDRDIAFDELVVATGSTRTGADVPGFEHTLSCADEEETLALRERLANLATLAPGNARVVVVGGGLTGVELAAELGERRPELAITLVTEGEVAPSISPDARAYVRRALAARRVALVEHAAVAAIEARALVLANGDELASDATVWCAGLAPSPLPARIGLPTDDRGRALVDARLRSLAHDFVHVIGDAARLEMTTPNGEVPLRMACATAMPMGAFAADDLARSFAGEETAPFPFSFYLQCMSLGRASGIVQRVDACDSPRGRWYGGRRAAWVKEGLCRYTMLGMAAERRGWSYRWPRGRLAPEPRTPLLVAGAR